MSNSVVFPPDMIKTVLALDDDVFDDNEERFINLADGIVNEYQDRLEANFYLTDIQNVRFIEGEDYKLIYSYPDLHFYMSGRFRDLIEIGNVTFADKTYLHTFNQEDTYVFPTSYGFALKNFYWREYPLINSDDARYFTTTRYKFGLVNRNGSVRSDVQMYLGYQLAKISGRVRNVFRKADGTTDMEAFRMAIQQSDFFFETLKQQRQALSYV